jgi:TnpA family transposase
MLRKFGSYPRPNGLAIALRELGRIERSLFILDWLQSVDLRRRVHASLNKGEARNALAGVVHNRNRCAQTIMFDTNDPVESAVYIFVAPVSSK